MRHTTLSMRGIARYRRSALAARGAGCCRFSPSCSHYAEQALERRAFPVAVLLIARQLLRCRPSVPAGTVDLVPPPQPLAVGVIFGVKGWRGRAFR